MILDREGWGVGVVGDTEGLADGEVRDVVRVTGDLCTRGTLREVLLVTLVLGVTTPGLGV